MSMENTSHFTRCGLPGIELLPFGTHACHFYRDRDHLIEALVPYFVAGLEQNERCLWITASPLSAREAIQALRAAWDGADDAIHSGALRILDFERWYANSQELKGVAVVDLWLSEEERALAEGYNGLRITGNTSFLTPADWATFMDYEHAVSMLFRGRRIVALCSYDLGQCDEGRIAEVMESHHCAFECPDNTWQVVAPLARGKAENGDGAEDGSTFASLREAAARANSFNSLASLDQAALDALPDAVYLCAADGRLIRFNRRAAELWGRTPVAGDPNERFCGSLRLFSVDGTPLPHEQCPMAAAVQAGGSFENEEVVIEQPNGRRLTVLVNITALKDENGRVHGAINCFRDITERKEIEERQRFLLDELNHRIKNTLATVHSLAASTARSAKSVEEFIAHFEARLTALSRAHALLSRGEQNTATLRALLTRQFEPYSAKHNRVRLDGPHLELQPRLAYALSMVFHELVTNAAKYGPLSVAEGKVSVEWEVSPAADGRDLTLTWVESNGPTVKQPRRRGFGTRLIERTIQDELAGEARLSFEPWGLRLDARVPLRD